MYHLHRLLVRSCTPLDHEYDDVEAYSTSDEEITCTTMQQVHRSVLWASLKGGLHIHLRCVDHVRGHRRSVKNKIFTLEWVRHLFSIMIHQIRLISTKSYRQRRQNTELYLSEKSFHRRFLLSEDHKVNRSDGHKTQLRCLLMLPLSTLFLNIKVNRFTDEVYFPSNFSLKALSMYCACIDRLPHFWV